MPRHSLTQNSAQLMAPSQSSVSANTVITHTRISIEDFSNKIDLAQLQVKIVKYEKKYFGDSVSLSPL